MKIFPNILNNLIKESLDKFLMKEALSSKVYHFTSIKSAFNILKTNEMFCQSSLATSADDYSDKYKFYVSFTRVKSPKEGFGYNSYKRKSFARIEFDGDKLNNNFNGRPVDYWNNDSLTNKRKYMKDVTNQKAYKYVPYDGNDNVDAKDMNGVYKYDFKYPKEDSPMYASFGGKIYKKEQIIPDDIQHHVFNEIEDRIQTNKPIIENINKYITRVDILIDRDSENKDDIVYARHLSFSKFVFVYDNMKDFIMQSENTVNKEIQDDDSIESRIDLRDTLSTIGQSYYIELLSSYLMLLTINERDTNKKFKLVSNILDDGNLGKYKRDVIKKISSYRWGVNIEDCINSLKVSAQNISKNPTRQGQEVLHFMTSSMRKLGYKSFRDMYIKIKEGNSKKESKIDTESRRTFTILETSYYKFDITDEKNVDFWYILGMKERLSDRYYFFENIIDEMVRNGLIDKVRGGEYTFTKYCKNLAHKNITLGDIDSIFGKIGLTFQDLFEMYGLTFSIETKDLNYWDFIDERVNAPFPYKNDDLWEQRHEYAMDIFKIE